LSHFPSMISFMMPPSIAKAAFLALLRVLLSQRRGVVFMLQKTVCQLKNHSKFRMSGWGASHVLRIALIMGKVGRAVPASRVNVQSTIHWRCCMPGRLREDSSPYLLVPLFQILRCALQDASGAFHPNNEVHDSSSRVVVIGQPKIGLFSHQFPEPSSI
jgi:hypothetical protein